MLPNHLTLSIPSTGEKATYAQLPDPRVGTSAEIGPGERSFVPGVTPDVLDRLGHAIELTFETEGELPNAAAGRLLTEMGRQGLAVVREQP